MSVGRFWLQLCTFKKFSEPRVSLNEGAKEVENGESWTYLLRGRHRVDSCVPCAMCRNLLGYSPCTDLELIATSGGRRSGCLLL